MFAQGCVVVRLYRHRLPANHRCPLRVGLTRQFLHCHGISGNRAPQFRGHCVQDGGILGRLAGLHLILLTWAK